MHAKYEVPISYGAKGMPNVNVGNRQTDTEDISTERHVTPPPPSNLPQSIDLEHKNTTFVDRKKLID